MNDIDRLLAKAQVWLAVLVAAGFLGVLGALLFIASVPAAMRNNTVVTLLTGLLATLGTIFTLQMNYFYARHRPQGLPDPASGDVPNPTEPPRAAKS